MDTLRRKSGIKQRLKQVGFTFRSTEVSPLRPALSFAVSQSAVEEASFTGCSTPPSNTLTVHLQMVCDGVGSKVMCVLWIGDTGNVTLVFLKRGTWNSNKCGKEHRHACGLPQFLGNT